MITASKLAGFFAAHAIWSVSDGDTLVPMLVYTTESDERKMERLVIQDDLGASVAYGKRKLEANEMDANDAALLYDGRIPLGAEKADAIIIEMRASFSPGSEAILAIPYTPKASGAFKVHKPKLLEWTECEDFDVNTALQSFFAGVDEHEKGRKIWADCLDESK
ncbi:MAG: hypothetical protein ABJF10_29070 [Chthoniobacter sp.]|uniref:hypothetical protein n=1 Tax=Chthoniobacter sp. TaxID=2510640 RepID=UPI0032A8D60B